MPKLDSTRYTFLFATIVCVVCALLVAVSAVGLHDKQQANALLYRQKNVLLAAGLVKPADELSETALQKIFDDRIRVRLVDLATGDLVPVAKQDPRTYDQQKARNDPAQSRAAPPNNAGVSRLPLYGAVYFVMKGSEVQLVVLPLEGVGMWGTLYGFLALESRRQHGARPHLLRPEGNARPGRRNQQSEVAGGLDRPQDLQRQLGAAAGRHQREGRAAEYGSAARRRPVRCDDHEQWRLAADGVLDVERRVGALPPKIP